MSRYRVLIGVNYVPDGATSERRAEPGEIVDDLPSRIVAEWLKARVIEPDKGKGGKDGNL